MKIKNADWEFSALRVSKYNPLNRDKEWRYLGNEWTCYSDIGSKFNDHIVTVYDYLEVEKSYIEAAVRFFKLHNCSVLKISSLQKLPFENYSFIEEDKIFECYQNIQDNSVVPLEESETLIKLVLRGLAWFELFCNENEDIAVRFGYDFYMFFNSPLEKQFIKNEIKVKYLFIE